MKNSLRKNLVTILIAIFVVMLSFSALTAVGVKADTTEATPIDIQDAVITMHDGASIKQTGNMGIRFRATITSDVYGGLEANSDYENVSYGMIIAPADFVDADDEMNVDGWTVTVDQEEVDVKKYEGTLETGVKYFQMATVTPKYNTDSGLYEIYGAFVGVLEENYARDFTVRAFICADDEYVYSTQTSRNVYTVATYAMESGAIEDNDAAETYFKEITGAVNTAYASGYTVNVENLTDNGAKIEVGDKIRFTATLTDGNGNSIEAKPTLSSIDGKLTQNVDESTGLGDGTYTVEKAGDFYVNANVNGTVDGKAASKSRAIWLDGVNATGTVTEYDLDSTPNFFTKGANTTLVKGELPADTTSNLYKAMTTNPTDKDVVVFNSPNGGTAASDVLYLGKEYKADIVGKYLSFKYYSTHNGANSGGWAFTTRQMHNSGYDGSMGSTTYGRYILNQYDSNYQLIESNLTSSNCYGTWVTVEVKVMEWSTSSDNFGMIHINVENTNKYLYFTDFKVSDYSIYNEGYSDLEISVSGETGADGVVNVDDVLTVTAKALPLGATEKVEVPAALTFDDGALTLNADGTYTYTGATGDFTLTATWWCGLSAETELKAKIKPEVTAIVPTVSGVMTLTEVDKGSLAISVDGVSTVYQATTTASGETNQIIIATSSNNAEYSGKIVSFKYYYTGTFMAFNVIDLELATSTLDHTTRGTWTFKSYDKDGNEIPAQSSGSTGKTYFNNNLSDTWITVEVEVTAIKSRGLWIHFDTASTVYFADFQVSNISMFS